MLSHQTFIPTRFLAITSFLIYIASQACLFVLDDPPSKLPYYPHPYFLPVYFVIQIILQIYWLKGLFTNTGNDRDYILLEPIKDTTTQNNEEETAIHGVSAYRLNLTQTTYLPFYVAGNLCLAAWSIAWLQKKYILSQALISINLMIYLCVLCILFSVSRRSSLSRESVATHVLIKITTGMGMLYIWKNWGIIDKVTAPKVPEIIHSGIIHLVLTVSAGPDPTLGICLLYNLTALLFGQNNCEEWHRAFRFFIIAVSAAVVTDVTQAKRRGLQFYHVTTPRTTPDDGQDS